MRALRHGVVAKPGDIVEFRSGLHGIDAPRNIAVFVRRWKQKGTPWVEMVTAEGRKDVKADHLSRRMFRDRYEGALDDTSEIQARLKFLIGQHADGHLVEEVDDDLAALEEQLWAATCNAGEPLTEAVIAGAVYGDASPMQLKQVRAALDRCRRPGVGRFETAGKGDLWRPWTDDERERMASAWNALERLRAKLVAVDNTDDGRSFRRIDLEAADLDADDQDTLAWVQAAMVQFIDHDGVPERNVAGIGGIGATNAFGMDLHRTLGFLAMDWIRSGHTTRSSDYVHFLIETGLWSPTDAIDGLMRRHVNQEAFFEHTADDQAESDANELPEPRLDDDPQREDLRALNCFTIDPPDAKDFDDAVGLETTPAGQRLWVHIADVSHYVRPGTHLDRHAKNRATSVYLPGRVLPMLPHRIADHLCSLRDDGDRFALSVAMDIAPDGRITGATFHDAIIRVNENLSYDDALARRAAGDQTMAQLFDLAERMRTHRAGLDLDTGEIRVSVGADGFEATEKRGNDATRMIEAFMVAANITVAKHLRQEETPLLFRCHPLPDATKAERFAHQATTMGLDIAMDLPKPSSNPASGQSLLDQLKAGGGSINLFGGGFSTGPGPEPEPDDETPDEDVGFATLSPEDQDAWLAPFRAATSAIAAMPSRGAAEVATWKLLACMGRAYYAPENEGHFGLSASHYCHFTSPIRRYPDLVVHRNLKWLIRGRNGPMPHAFEDLQRLCDHCSNQERAAEGLERRVKSAALVLASLHGDQAFAESPARISGIVPGGLFVTLGAGLDARIGLRDIPGGPYQVDEWESMLYLIPGPGQGNHVDEESGEERLVKAKLAQPVTVRLAGRDVADGKTAAVLSGLD